MSIILKAALQGEELKTIDGYDKHINCEGSREHVLSYTSNGVCCSHKNCIINKDNKENISEWIFIK